MIVEVNGERCELAEGATVASLVEQRSTRSRGVAVALDGEVVPRGEWAATSLSEGAKVEVLVAVQGG